MPTGLATKATTAAFVAGFTAKEESAVFNYMQNTLRDRLGSTDGVSTAGGTDRQSISWCARHIEADAAALSRIMLSPRTPQAIRTALGDALAEFLDLISQEQPDVLRARYPLAVLKAEADEKAEAAKGGAQ